ncbi:MAG: NAD-dependent epimerase/dehydratase family protein [Nitrosopumilus sp.]|nr:NAD-dependent epimerase/dehydratase family protein [Nitrosopumilus sp.]MDF2425397.1 NAD-dependent epimerase/dehydratase family protein [Nitrosopumilus sp.]MDF2426935.1 NAD-dependent epimerase/dehydratase family protein [Nitrosopumilus sp.]MDF2428936.1 NAD-dependent epimerase/dehydratase family protein [Nitrosopumilus sp.]MDF2429426.1 NAD-dependent epimerase/dehydratase family protein [Nitrosopumilus sp.]
MDKFPKIVVTGASGFIAKNLRKHLSEKNVDLISISRNDFKNFKSESKIISKNYDGKKLLHLIKNSDALIHLVGVGKQSVNSDYDAINAELTRHVVNLSKKANIKKIVYLSGLGVSAKTTLGYFISKYNAENFIADSGLDYTVFRPSYIVGTDDMFTKYLKRQIKNGEINIPGSGAYSIQPIHISDVVKIIFESVLQPKFNNKIIDLVGPDFVTFEKYVKLFSKGTKTSIKKIRLEDAYHDAITNPKSDFGVDDLNILIGNFKGNHEKLKKVAGMKFKSVVELLQSRRLP